MNIAGLRSILPARPCNFVDIHQKLVHGNRKEIMIAPLAGKVLDALHGFPAVGGGLDNEVKATRGLRVRSAPQQKLRPAQYPGQRIVEVMRHT